MPIGKKNKEKGNDWGEFADKARVYTNAELNDFHHKIQRFKVSKTLSTGEVVKVLDWDEMAVAYGAFNRVKVGDMTYYMAAGGPDGNTARYAALVNLWDQMNSYLIRKDMAKEHEEKELLKMAELSTV